MTNKKVLKLAVLGAALVCLLVCAASVLTACDEAKKYHAEFYDDVEEFMNDEFLKENRVGQAFYKIDFTNQLIIVYMFVTTTPRNFEMTDLSLKEGVLRVSYKVEMSMGDRLHSIKDDVMAYRRCFALVMDKTDITTAEFEER